MLKNAKTSGNWLFRALLVYVAMAQILMVIPIITNAALFLSSKKALPKLYVKGRNRYNAV